MRFLICFSMNKKANKRDCPVGFWCVGNVAEIGAASGSLGGMPAGVRLLRYWKRVLSVLFSWSLRRVFRPGLPSVENGVEGVGIERRK